MPETFSCNTVGYVDRTVPAGWSMLSNPLVGQSFCIPDLFAGVSVGFKVDTWDDYSQAWLEDVYQGNGVWSGPDCMQVRQPPEFGCLVYNPQTTNLVVTFIGHVWQAYYEDAFPVSPAQCIRSMPVPDGGWLGRQLHFQAAEGTTLFKMVNGSYQSYRYISGVWLPFEPVIDVGDAFWLNTPAWVWKHYDQTWPNGGKY